MKIYGKEFQLITQLRRGSQERRFRVKMKMFGLVWIRLGDCKSKQEAMALIESRMVKAGGTIDTYNQSLPALGEYMDVFYLVYTTVKNGQCHQHQEQYYSEWSAVLHKWIVTTFEKDKLNVNLYVKAVKLPK